MKKSLLIAVLAILPLSAPLAWAEDPRSAQDKKSAAPLSDKDKQTHMRKMQEDALRMHEQMHKIMQAKDANERERLMQEHSKMMQDHMSMMRSMKGGGMKGPGRMGDDAKGGGKMDGMRGM